MTHPAQFLFTVWEGGGEYNVARGLRRCFGMKTAVATAFADKLAVAYLHLAAYRDSARSTVDLETFETVVVAVGVLGLRGKLALVRGIVDHDVGVAPYGDGSLARE